MFLGIDLGTSNSVVYGIVDGRPRLFKTADGADALPSVIYVDKRGVRLYGRRAQDQALLAPESVAHGFKRLMGTATPIELTESGIKLSPEECSADIIRQLIAQAMTETGVDEFSQIVITIPAAFNQMQSEATLRAAERAGITAPIKLLQEPVAAAIAAAHGDMRDGYFLIYDLGGGTFDLALAECKNGEIKIVANQGINMLGGRDFDRRLVQDIIRPWLVENYDLPDDYMRSPQYRRLLRVAQLAAEKAKIELSSRETVTIFASDEEVRTEDISGADIFLDIKVSRSEFEAMIDETVERTVAVAQSLLTEEGLKASDIGRLVFIGGPSKIPLIRQKVAGALGISPDLSLDPMTTVALGAAYYAAQVGGKPVAASDGVKGDIKSIEIAENGGSAAAPQINVAIPAAKTIAVKVRDAENDQNKLVPILQEGTMLPAAGTQSFIAGQNLSADEDGYLAFELFQLEFPERLELNLCVGAFRISSQDLPADVKIAEGDTLDFNWQMNDSGILTATVTLGTVELTSPRFYAPQEGERSYAGEQALSFASAILQQAQDELEDILAALGPVTTRDIDLIRRRLQEQERTLADAADDPEMLRQVSEEGRFIRQDMARLSRRHAASILQRRVGRLVAAFNRTASGYTNDEEQKEFSDAQAGLYDIISSAAAQRAEAMKESKIGTLPDGGVSATSWYKAEKHLADIRRLFFAAGLRNPAYLNLWYEQVKKESYLFPDSEEYAELIAAADAAKTSEDNEKLQQVMAKILSARISVGASDSAADPATILQA